MKGKVFNISIFILSLMSLLISIKLFWNMGVYVDEFNTSPDVVLGGNFGLLMEWMRLGLLSIVCVLSGINIFKNKQ